MFDMARILELTLFGGAGAKPAHADRLGDTAAE